MSRVRYIKKYHHFQWYQLLVIFSLTVLLGSMLLLSLNFWLFEQRFTNRVYPGVYIQKFDFSGKTYSEVKQFWLIKNRDFADLSSTLSFEDITATISADLLDIGYDASMSATQALAIGRSSNFFSDFLHKIEALDKGIYLEPFFKWNKAVVEETIETLAQQIDIEPENALFEFQNNRVSAFKQAKNGRAIDKSKLVKQLETQLSLLPVQNFPDKNININIPVLVKKPLIDIEDANNFGIKELIGAGESFFQRSIPGRIHNVVLAASRVNGVLIPPGKTFSFNDAIGDISATTGYKQAYVIKSGRTVLDDGGGVCQVSTTLFRAALDAGLDIAERHGHSYRVAYYEQGGWKPGFDATVYAPNYDLKIQNNTASHILIQTKTDTDNLKLTFELYGQKDNREVEISEVRLWDTKPAPPDLHQDDPTLPAGTVKQIDWAHPGIKAAFDYKVTKDGKDLSKETFFTNYIPWQAVFLRATAQ